MYLLEMRGVYKSYQLHVQEVPVLHDINLKVAPGEFVSIMGPSGSGKSTLMNLIGCLDRPNKGTYLLNGVQVQDLNDAELSTIRNREVGFVFQKFNLLTENTATQNIALPLTYRGIAKKDREKLAAGVAERVGIGERLNHRPNELSGGQAQRVAIARALLGEPHLILADEPTGSLDSQTGQEILAIFHELHQQGHTIVMVTHDEKVAHEAERIIRLKDGRIVKDEQHKETIAKDAIHSTATQHNLKWRDIFGIAVREGLLAHPLRTLLTMLGVLFGVAAVIAMMAINEGARQKAIAQIEQMGLNNIRIRSIKLSEEERQKARQHLSQGLSLQDLQSLQQLPSVKHIAPMRYVKAEISRGVEKLRGNIIGTTSDYQIISNINLKYGRFLRDEDHQQTARVCVLGSHLHQQMFGKNNAVGRTIYIGTEVFTIIGTIQGKNTTENDFKGINNDDINSNIYIPLSTATIRFFNRSRSSELDEITLMVDNSENLTLTSRWISRILNKRHYEIEDFTVIVPQELIRQEQETQKIFDVVMVCIASISLVVGGIGIMNIMLAAITERIREVGIRRAIGANEQDILKQFLTEAVTISLSGGILGISAGWLLAIGISSYTGWTITISLASILLGVGVSTTIGMLFGIYPAWKAARLDPIVALNT